MAVPVSYNLEKCKLKNQKEQRLYQRVIAGVTRSQIKSLHHIDRERLALMQQLQINRRKALHSSLKESMTFEDRLTLMRRDLGGLAHKRNPTLFDRSKGFSKVKIQEDENDRNMYYSHKRQKALRISSHSLPEVKNYVLTDDDVYVYYPIPRPNSKPSTVVSVSELNEFRKRRSFLTEGQLKSFSATSHSRSPKPDYTKKLERISPMMFDQYTDGTMHLEERRLRQRQKEFVPPQVGHLPVHKRNQSEKAELIHAQLDMNPHLLSNVATLPAKNIKIYLPRSAKTNKQSEDSEEQKRFLKLKQEHQAQEFAKVMKKTSTFLGSEPSYLHSIRRHTLKKEETVLLEQMRKKMMSFKTAATLVSWLTKSHKRSMAKEKSVCFSEQSEQPTQSVVKD